MQVIVIMQVMSCCAASRHLLKDEFLRLDRRRSPLEELVRLSPLGVLPQIHREDEQSTPASSNYNSHVETDLLAR